MGGSFTNTCPNLSLAYTALVSEPKNNGFLRGQLLIAAPGMGDPRFARTLLYMCGHDDEHAMGLVINQPMHALDFQTLLRQLKMQPEHIHLPDRAILAGGPVDTERGFVLHSLDYDEPKETLRVSDHIGMSASREILLAMAEGGPPAKCLLALGLSSWGPGQIEQELEANAWLVCEPDETLVFDLDFASKWDRAMFKIGVDPDRFSDTVGHA
jgi:putative transcriptional regulator